MEGAHEVGEVAEADIVGDIGDRPLVLGQQPRRPPQAPARQLSARSPIASTSSGASRKDRHSSPQTWSCVHMYSSPGWPTRIDPATSSNDRPRLRQPKLPLRT